MSSDNKNLADINNKDDVSSSSRKNADKKARVFDFNAVFEEAKQAAREKSRQTIKDSQQGKVISLFALIENEFQLKCENRALLENEYMRNYSLYIYVFFVFFG